MKFTFDGALWVDPRWQALHTHITLPREIEDTILEVVDGATNGWGSIRVQVMIGTSTWRTSLFPAGPGRSYIVPVKRAIRDNERLVVGEVVTVHIDVVDF